MFFLQVSELASLDGFIRFRPYFIVIAFIIGMVLTPPDVLSQLVLAIPLCLLYEVGLLICRFHKKNNRGNKAYAESENNHLSWKPGAHRGCWRLLVIALKKVIDANHTW